MGRIEEVLRTFFQDSEEKDIEKEIDIVKYMEDSEYTAEAILRENGLPEIKEEMDIKEKLEILIEIEKSKLLDGFSVRKDFLEKMDKIDEYKKKESETDTMEIELARISLEKIRKYEKYNSEDLKKKLEEYRDLYPIQAELKEHRSLIEKLKRNKELLVNYCGFLYTPTANIYKKLQIVEELKASSKLWCRVLRCVLERKKITVEEISKVLHIARSDVLKTIYGLSSKNIIEYNRIDDVVFICTS